MKMSLVSLFFIIFISNITLSQQNQTDSTKSQSEYDTYDDIQAPKSKEYTGKYFNYIGLKFSTISGSGLSLSRKFNKFTFTINSIIYYSESTEWSDLSKTNINNQSSDNFINYGAEVKFDFLTTNQTNTYAFIGGSILNTSQKDRYDNREEDTSIIGLGFGLEWFLSSNFVGDIHFGYKYDKSKIINFNTVKEEKRTFVGIGVGISYLF